MPNHAPMLCTTEMVLRQDIGHVLDEAQSSLHGHQKLLRALEVVLGRHQLEEFFEAFFELLKRALVVYKREPAVERVVDFVAKFAVATAPKCNEDEGVCVCVCVCARPLYVLRGVVISQKSRMTQTMTSPSQTSCLCC